MCGQCTHGQAVEHSQWENNLGGGGLLNEYLPSVTRAASCAASEHKGTAHDAVPDTAQHLKNCMVCSTKEGGDF